MKEENELDIKKEGGVAMKVIGWLITILGFGFLFVKAFGNMTGFIINKSIEQAPNYTYLIGLLVVGVGVVVLYVERRKEKGELEKKIKVRGILFEDHALQRMEKRGIYPIVVEDVIKHGEHYDLKHKFDFGEAKGATDVYIRRHIADIAPGGKPGERIIKVEPNKKREYESVLVLADEEGTVKTTYIANDKNLSWFMNKYIAKEKEKRKAA